jgi:ubiquinol-cytochrome c reductase cytochrome b subunit
MPFLVAAFAIIHLIMLHEVGSNNPLKVKSYDNIALYPYFIIKDLFLTFFYLIFFSYLILIDPFYLNHVDNFMEANPLVTPIHIQPE